MTPHLATTAERQSVRKVVYEAALWRELGASVVLLFAHYRPQRDPKE